jgi:hypothetical protein
MIIKMEYKPLTYLLDGASGITFLSGLITGQDILMLLGGLASVLAAINHGQQILQRRKNKK